MTMADSNITTEFMMKAIKLEFDNGDLRKELDSYKESNKQKTLQIIQLLQEIEQLKAELNRQGKIK